MSPVRRRVRVVGIGAGHPDQVTIEAVSALDEVDVFVVADKRRGDGGATDDLVALREEVLRRHVTHPHRVTYVEDPKRDRSTRVDDDPAAYERAVAEWHEARVEAYERVLADDVADGETVGFLVWGDPAFYDSTIRIVGRMAERGHVVPDWDVVPGISALQLLAARHRIVLNDVGAPLTVTTGRQLMAEVDAGREAILVVLNRDFSAAALLDEAHGEWDLWWGANLGTPGEALVAGPLAEVADEVVAERDRVKARHGWVMDTYLLRRRG
ncbi:precorrin-6A synthase (deacetylating) [Solicola sp. PLA-1-18]|uniref:precorrin-6A synthase (deacetylating) n=1 Tax=Solicola sp. PLA-1-18 TaxID=3380532 RepID=UPI003B7CC1BA